MKKLLATLTAVILVISISTAAFAAYPSQGSTCAGKYGTNTVTQVSSGSCPTLSDRDLSGILSGVLSDASGSGSQGTWRNAGNVYYYIGGSGSCPTNSGAGSNCSTGGSQTAPQNTQTAPSGNCPAPTTPCPVPTAPCPTTASDCNNSDCGSRCGQTDCGKDGVPCLTGTDCSKVSCGKDGRPCITDTTAGQTEETAPAAPAVENTPAADDTAAPVSTPAIPVQAEDETVTDDTDITAAPDAADEAEADASETEGTSAPDTEEENEADTDEAPAQEQEVTTPADNNCATTPAVSNSLYNFLVSLLSKCGIDASKLTFITSLCPQAPSTGGNTSGGDQGTPSDNGGTPTDNGTTPGGGASDPNGGNSSTTPQPNVDNLSFEEQVVALVNQERAANGLAPLTLNTELSNVARAKSQDMHDNGYFSHTSPTYGSPFDMMKAFGISYRTAGENIAMGYRTPEDVMNGWMNSSGHRANILKSSFTQIGVGYVADGNYWTQMFIG